MSVDVNLSVALASARTYLNDDAASIWSDAALIPKAQDAHRELQTMLWEVGSPAVRAVSGIITVAATTTDPTSLTNYPSDMFAPFKLQEFATSDSLANAIDMTETFYLPNLAQGTTLKWWTWQNEKIVLLGASADRKMVIYYRKEIPIPASSSDPIGIAFGELYIGPRTAAIAHGSLGNKDAYTIVTGFAEANFKKVVAAQRGQQTPPMRP